mgnify:CR=1 FL=1
MVNADLEGDWYDEEVRPTLGEGGMGLIAGDEHRLGLGWIAGKIEAPRPPARLRSFAAIGDQSYGGGITLLLVRC